MTECTGLPFLHGYCYALGASPKGIVLERKKKRHDGLSVVDNMKDEI